MLHIHSRTPLPDQWMPAIHRRTAVTYQVLADDAAVETISGTMTGRAGDVLLRDADGRMWVLPMAMFREAYEAN